MKPLFCLLAALTLGAARAESLAEYVAARAGAQASPQAILGELLTPEVIITTSNQVRATRQQELALKALVVTNLLNDVQWGNVALRDERIDNVLDTRMGRANLTDAEFIALAKTKARIELLRAKITRAGGDPTGPLSGAASVPVQVRTLGQAPWQTLTPALPAPPTLAQVRAALSAARNRNQSPTP